MKTDDMYFVSILFAYEAELDEVKECDHRKEFCFITGSSMNVYLLEGTVPLIVKDVSLEDIYNYYQKRKLLYPPNFPDGRRRFLELLHADKF